ncbi:MFS transporter [Paenibacillus roseipurpureus]|uniref:MFS transporter n=1 Tax=Paenibacillus roseopurpureus TaxID=2918901 RepID=A0AA96RK33_9BACL|nr:MFS transporter [Paenibacillus sp. MBLB1832]WNR44420.1 MFS transporter [Paenibacillus sp. MBLB1832]
MNVMLDEMIEERNMCMQPMSGNAAPLSEPEMVKLKKSVPWIYFVLFFAVLNESMFGVSTPSIMAQHHLSTTAVSWVVTVFFIVIGLGMVVFGRLSDIYSVKSLILTGVVLYSFGSILGFALNVSYPAVLVARALQGAGCAAIPALVFVMVARFFTAEERGKMFGMITSIVSFAIGVGPVLGGFIAGSLHWAYLFLVPLPILLAIPYFRNYLPEEQRRPGRLDLIGTLLMGTIITLLVLYTTGDNLWLLVGSLAALIVFVSYIRKAKEPFVDPALFQNKLYRFGLIIGFLTFGTVMAAMFTMPLLLSKLYGLNARMIGVIMFPGALSAMIFGRVGGNLTVKRGSRFVMYLGLSLLAFSLFLQAFSTGLSVWLIGASLVFMYIGFSFLQTALAESVTLVLPGHHIGVGMGFFNMVSTLAGAIVTAVVAKVLDLRLVEIRIHPLITDERAYAYSGLLLLTFLVVVGTLLLYVFTLGKADRVAATTN